MSFRHYSTSLSTIRVASHILPVAMVTICLRIYEATLSLRGDRRDLVGFVLRVGGEATSPEQPAVPTEGQTEVTCPFCAMCSSFVVFVSSLGSMRLKSCVSSSTGTLVYTSSLSARDRKKGFCEGKVIECLLFQLLFPTLSTVVPTCDEQGCCDKVL